MMRVWRCLLPIYPAALCTGIAPAEAMCGWLPHGLIVDCPAELLSTSAWIDKLRERAAVLCDHVEQELSTADEPSECCDNSDVSSCSYTIQCDGRSRVCYGHIVTRNE